MTTQKSFDFDIPVNFCNRVENNQESNAILQENKKRINRRCQEVLNILKTGERLTVISAVKKYDITSLPRRIKDLRDMAGIEIKDREIGGGCKEWWIQKEF